MKRVVLALLVAASGCGTNGAAPEAPAPGPNRGAPTRRLAPVPAKVVQNGPPANWEGPWRPGQTRQGPDLTVAYETSARIHLTGKDRWGHAIDITYETPRFFKEAIPALARSLSDPQTMRLRELAYLLAEP